MSSGAPTVLLDDESRAYAQKQAELLSGMLGGGTAGFMDMEAQLLAQTSMMQGQLASLDDPNSKAKLPEDVQKWKNMFDAGADATESELTDATEDETDTATDTDGDGRHTPLMQSPQPVVKTAPTPSAAPTPLAAVAPVSAPPSWGPEPDVGPEPAERQQRTVSPPVKNVSPPPAAASMRSPTSSSKSSRHNRSRSRGHRSKRSYGGSGAGGIAQEYAAADELLAKSRSVERAAQQSAQDAALHQRIQVLQDELAEEREKSKTFRDIAENAKLEATHTTAELAKLRQSVQASQNRLQQKEAELASLQTQLKERDALLQERIRAHRDLEERSALSESKFQQQLEQLVREKNSLTMATEQHIAESTRVKAQLRDKQAELRSVEASVRQLEKEREELKSDGSRQEERVESLKEQLRDKMKEIGDLRTQNLISTERLTIFEREKEAMKLGQESLQRASEKSNMAFEMKMNSVMERITEARSKEEEAKFTMEKQRLQNELDEQLDRFRSLEARTEKEIRDLRAQLAERTSELQERVSTFKNNITEAFDAKRAAELRLKTMEVEVAQLRGDVELHKHSAARAEDSLADLKDGLSRLRGEISDVRAQKQLVEERLEASEKEKEQLKLTIERTDDEKRRAVADKEKLSEALNMLKDAQESLSHSATPTHGRTQSRAQMLHSRTASRISRTSLQHGDGFIDSDGPDMHQRLISHHSDQYDATRRGVCCTTRSDGTRDCDPQCAVM